METTILGYKKLNGIEINPVAIQQMLTSFPRLEKAVSISNTDVFSGLKAMKDKSFDLVFTMGVAMHIHPSDNEIFKEMIRVGRKFVCTFEPESANSNYVFSRNYDRVFSKLGAKQIKSSVFRSDLTARLFSLQ